MNDKFVYSKMIVKKNDVFNICFNGIKKDNINEKVIKKACDKYFNNIDICRDVNKIIGDVRTLFRDIDEELLLIECRKKGEFDYKIKYFNNSLTDYIVKEMGVDQNFNFFYQKNGIYFNVLSKDESIINYINNNTYIDIYAKRLKLIKELKNISINKIDNDILYINEIYRLFYGNYPDYSQKNINIKIQNMVNILKEYGVKLFNNYNFNIYNEQNIPMSKTLNNIIDDAKPYININNCDIHIDTKYKELICIIKDCIRNSKYKDIDFDSAVTYLSMVLYASKNDLKLGYTLDDVCNVLNCSKLNAENGLRLYKSLNRNVYEKN